MQIINFCSTDGKKTAQRTCASLFWKLVLGRSAQFESYSMITRQRLKNKKKTIHFTKNMVNVRRCAWISCHLNSCLKKKNTTQFINRVAKLKPHSWSTSKFTFNSAIKNWVNNCWRLIWFPRHFSVYTSIKNVVRSGEKTKIFHITRKLDLWCQNGKKNII